MISGRSLLILGMTALLLAACGDVREDLGLGRNVPDEFAVVDRPPLSMPPDYSLRPPRPGVARPQEVDTSQQASQTLFKSAAPAAAPAGASKGEQALLQATGAVKADPSIRDTVDHEAAQKVIASPHLVERLTDWGGSDQKPATVVDPTAEAARIKSVENSNQPVTQGATPVIEKQESGWLGL